MSLYYRHSGQFSPVAVFLAFLCGALAAAVLGFLYAYIVLYLPLAGFVTFVISAGFGLGVGVAVARTARRCHLRNERVARWVALAAMLVGFYVSWAVWVYALMVRAEVEGVTLAACLKPSVLWEAIVAINKAGAWSIAGMEPTGIFLAVLWLLEAAILFGVAYITVELADPYCEKCRQWCVTRPIARIQPMDPAELQSVLEGRQLERLLLSQADDGEERMELDLSTCSKCNQLHTLSARHLTVKINDGKREMQSTHLVKHLIFSRDEALAVQNLHLLSPGGEEHST